VRRKNMYRIIIVVISLIMICCAMPALAGEHDDAVKWTKASGLSEPVKLETVNPKYPEKARQCELTGTVKLRVVIDTNGEVVDVDVLVSPHESFTEAATEAVWQWRWEPSYDADGNPVKVFYNLTVRFNIS
jgi:TonB family protein